MHRHIAAIKNRAEHAHQTGGVVAVDAEPLLELINGANAHEIRIALLEHALRHASERFRWLSDYHLNAGYSKDEARKLSDEFWSIQAGNPLLPPTGG